MVSRLTRPQRIPATKRHTFFHGCGKLVSRPCSVTLISQMCGFSQPCSFLRFGHAPLNGNAVSWLSKFPIQGLTTIATNPKVSFDHGPCWRVQIAAGSRKVRQSAPLRGALDTPQTGGKAGAPASGRPQSCMLRGLSKILLGASFFEGTHTKGCFCVLVSL